MQISNDRMRVARALLRFRPMVSATIRWFLRICLLPLAASPLVAAAGYDVSVEEHESQSSQWLQMALGTLDQFMLAGKEDNAARGAQFVDMFDWSPNKATREIGEFYEKKQEILAQYVSISKDIYGYEIAEKGFKGPNITMEGRVETREGFTAEFSARLVFRDSRWLILSFELDGV